MAFSPTSSENPRGIFNLVCFRDFFQTFNSDNFEKFNL